MSSSRNARKTRSRSNRTVRQEQLEPLLDQHVNPIDQPQIQENQGIDPLNMDENAQAAEAEAQGVEPMAVAFFPVSSSS